MAASSPLPILVRKYGGSSLATVDRIRAVAADLAAKHAEGRPLVVVVSAMGRTTDELDHLAHQVSPHPARRELDMLLSVGERITMSLLCMALTDLDVPALSLTGSQCGLITDSSHTDARILEVRPDRVRQALESGRVVVVAGFQGVSREREITTLGRGGSDATAVALAAALGAERCEILKDVDGVFTADPHRVRDALRHAALSYEEMEAIAGAGCGVVHHRAVSHAREHGVPLFVGSSFHDAPGTLVTARPSRPKDPAAPGRWRPLTIVAHQDTALLEVSDLPTGAGALPTELTDAVAACAPLAEWTRQDGRRQRWGVIGKAQDVSRLRDLLPPVGDTGRILFQRGLACLSLAGPPPPSWLGTRARLDALLQRRGLDDVHVLATGGALHLQLPPDDADALLPALHDLFHADQA
ncbi:MAG TPA: aspartate kinase [Candidatus Krumholzibacteria bacterium]|nr:aspartate kinase [Candidatus Krumholzibacteria bacterium]HRX50320.1 aspartate kinase [Candidatus Krumholzibacteria bacterium]